MTGTMNCPSCKGFGKVIDRSGLPMDCPKCKGSGTPLSRSTGKEAMSDTPNEAPRLTPTQRLHEVTLAALHREPRKASEEVEISRNAKGDWQFTVSGVAGDGETLEDVAARLIDLAGVIEEKFPLSRKQTFDRDYLPAEK